MNARSGYAVQRAPRAGRQGARRGLQLPRGRARGTRLSAPLGGARVFAAAAPRRHRSTGSATRTLNVPFFRRYFLGGASSLRGWGRFEVSAARRRRSRSAAHTHARELGGAPRADLGRLQRACAFVDAGNVWNNAWDVQAAATCGTTSVPGCATMTPVGAMRVDVGFQLNPIPGLLVNGEPEPRHFRFHFSIGQAF